MCVAGKKSTENYRLDNQMINNISGKCTQKSLTGIVVEVGGIGLKISVPLSSFERLGAEGSMVSLLTYLHVREEALELYGFLTPAERSLFVTLIGVNGVGPKMALAIQSRFNPDELYQVVADNDVRRLTTVKGIGRKTAERMMVELKGRLDIRPSEQFAPTTAARSTISEAVRALETLGFNTQQADEAVRKARAKLGEDAPIEDLEISCIIRSIPHGERDPW